MKNIKCIIIEDEPIARSILEKYISDINDLDCVGSFANCIDAFDFLQSNEPDLIFLDIHLPK